LAESPIIVWFRLDLRLSDHAALSEAAKTGAPVLPVYILDDETPGRFHAGGAARWWLHGSLDALDRELARLGGILCFRRGPAPKVLADLLDATGAKVVHATRGYEPWEPELEQAVKSICQTRNAEFRLFRGRLLFEPSGIVAGSGNPFRVFTPFWKACLAAPPPRAPLPAPTLTRFARAESDTLESLELLLAARPGSGLRATEPASGRLGTRSVHRTVPAMPTTAIISIRPRLAPSMRLHFARSNNQVARRLRRREHRRQKDRGAGLLARDRLARVLLHLLPLPTITHAPPRPVPARFGATMRALTPGKGETGYPADAPCASFLHRLHANRARMIVASFLVKHLLIPWQAGADWFLDTLVDADLANNSASWQWVAGSGADAAPYFRIFNPVLQGLKFDSTGDYVRTWVPELKLLPAPEIHAPWEAPARTLAEARVTLGRTYPEPIVEHTHARTRALAAFKTLRAD
jgi:deoxyribodipyrimidine photo-lyase